MEPTLRPFEPVPSARSGPVGGVLLPVVQKTVPAYTTAWPSTRDNLEAGHRATPGPASLHRGQTGGPKDLRESRQKETYKC
eukprot:7106-Eustigmatos_ZCMA.PRE.1